MFFSRNFKISSVKTSENWMDCWKKKNAELLPSPCGSLPLSGMMKGVPVRWCPYERREVIHGMRVAAITDDDSVGFLQCFSSWQCFPTCSPGNDTDKYSEFESETSRSHTSSYTTESGSLKMGAVRSGPSLRVCEGSRLVGRRRS